MAAIQKMFKELGNAKTRSIIRDSMKRHLKPVKEEAEFNAPHDTGMLEKALRIKSISKRNWFGVDIVIDKVNFPDQFYGAFQELGSIHNERQPYLRPAAITDGPQAIDAVINDVIKRVDDVAT